MFVLLGILFLMAIGGMLAGLVSLLFKGTRFLSAYLFLAPFCAAFLAFWFFWGGGLLVERIFGPTRWSTLGAFLGYVSGLMAGGATGIVLAWAVNTRLSGRGGNRRD